MNENKAHQAKDSQVGEKQKILISENSTMTDTRTHTHAQTIQATFTKQVLILNPELPELLWNVTQI